MMRRTALSLFLLWALLPSAALAEQAAPATKPSEARPSERPEPLWALDAAPTRPAGSWSVGVFAPLRYAFTDAVEVEVHPLLSLVAPTALVRVAHLKGPGLALTGEYGLSVPTFGLSLTRGYLFPSGEETGKLGWYAIPRAGLVASVAAGAEAQLTGRADLAVGIPVAGETTVRSLDSFLAPLDLLAAPMLRGFRTHVGAGYDRALLPWLRVRTSVDGYLVGAQPEGDARSSPLFLSAHVGLDLRVGRHGRFTLGGIWWNWDQFRTEVRTGPDGYAERRRVRSNDFLPTLDFIWAG